MIVSNVSSNVLDCSVEDSEWTNLDFTMYVPSSWRERLFTVVLRRTSALDARAKPSKICQLPPATDMAPSVTIQTIVSNPWIRGIF